MTGSAQLVVGIFVGGRGSRMGGAAKGLLQAPASEKSLLERLIAELAGAVPGAEIVLVGSAEPYAFLGLKSVADAPPNVGPLGGVLGLLSYCEQAGARYALALACDLPRLERGVLSRLATEAAAAGAVVTLQAGVRNPLVARYDVTQALPAARAVLAAGARSLQAVLDRLGDAVVTLPLTADEEASLQDWDTPEDMR